MSVKAPAKLVLKLPKQPVPIEKSRKREEVVPVVLLDDRNESVKRSKSSSSSEQDKDVAQQTGVTVDSQALVNPKPRLTSASEILKDLEHQHLGFITEIDNLQKERYHLKTSNQSLTEKVWEMEQRLEKVVTDCTMLKSQFEVAVAEKAALKSRTDGQLRKLRDDVEKFQLEMEANKGKVVQNPKLVNELLALKSQQPVILHEKLVAKNRIFALETEVEKLNKECLTMQDRYNNLQKSHDELKEINDSLQIGSESLKHQIIKKAALLMLMDPTKEKEIKLMACDICYAECSKKFEEETEDRVMKNFAKKLKPGSLKGLLVTNPALAGDLEEEAMVLMRKDLALKARRRAVLNQEIKQEIIDERVKVIVDEEKLKIEQELTEIKAHEKYQDDYVKRKHAEYNTLLGEHEKLKEENRQLKHRKKSRSRDRSRSTSTKRNY